MVYLYQKWLDFPWQTVSHYQMVSTLQDNSEEFTVSWCKLHLCADTARRCPSTTPWCVSKISWRVWGAGLSDLGRNGRKWKKMDEQVKMEEEIWRNRCSCESVINKLKGQAARPKIRERHRSLFSDAAPRETRETKETKEAKEALLWCGKATSPHPNC